MIFIKGSDAQDFSPFSNLGIYSFSQKRLITQFIKSILFNQLYLNVFARIKSHISPFYLL